MEEAQTRIAVAVRFVMLAVLLTLSVLLDRRGEVRPLVEILGIAAVVSVLALILRVRQIWLAVLEGLAVSIVVVASGTACLLGIPYLLVPVFVAATRARWLSVVIVLAVEALTIAAFTYRFDRLSEATTLGTAGRSLIPVLLVGIAAVPVVYVGHQVGRQIQRRTQDDEVTYRNAITLITQLDEISARLSGGLDPVSLAEEMMSSAEEMLPVQQSVVYAKGSRERVYPLRYSAFSAPEGFGEVETLVQELWSCSQPRTRGLIAGVPVRTTERTVAVLILQLTHETDQRSLERLQASLRGQALRLQAALLFDSVRTTATSEERNRLAREVHDGVAQDVASLGYVIDVLCNSTEDPEVREGLVGLRRQITKVVAELRASVYDLRNEMRAGQGLGQGVSAFARQIGSRSDLTVHVRLDEGATRLRPDVEAELLRIAQEAMNNARKHSEGSNLWVSCTVRPPYAEISVIDDGAGLQPARADSQGMRIMHERAQRIGAELEIGPRPEEQVGTRLSVRLARP